MRFVICVVAVLAVACAAGAVAPVVPEGFTTVALDQNFMGGFDYLPNGDIIGMYTEPLMADNAYVAVVDANGDGIPSGVSRVYEFNRPTYGITVKVSPDGSRVLFGDSDFSSFKLYSMSLPDYTVTEVVCAGGTFQGAFDLAFIDGSSCYLSANPGTFPATTNKIYRLDLASGRLTELASIGGTFAGPLDVDEEGNLYYVRGKANFPPQAGDFTLLRFGAAELAEALEGGTVLTQADATELKNGLDGGYGVAWHGSGDLFVADANNGKIYRIAANGAASEFASLPGDQGEGFNALSIFDGLEPFSGGVRSGCQLAANYLPLPGVATPKVYRISPLPPLVNAVVSATSVSAGSRLALTVTAQPQAGPFDAYIVLSGPGGITFSVTGNGLPSGVKTYASAVPGLAREFKAMVLDMVVPPAAAGAWTIYTGLMPAGTPAAPAAALALDTVGVVMR
jgi:hypothetical protein